MKQAELDARINDFIDKYTPDVAAAIRACRRKLLKRVPHGVEMVYDNYNALVFAFGPSEKQADLVLSIAAYPKWVTLFFWRGSELDDPAGLLTGTGSQVRGIRLGTPDDLDCDDVKALIAQALRAQEAAFKAAATIKTVIKSVSAKQRPRRPAGA
jgi:hypothetical protein